MDKRRLVRPDWVPPAPRPQAPQDISVFKVRANERGLITYNVTLIPYNSARQIPGQCNSITFINQGTSVALINGVLRISPQQSWTVDGNEGEWDNGTYQLTFDETSGTNNYLVVVRKVYQS